MKKEKGNIVKIYFKWDDIKKIKTLAEFYDKIGLTDVVKASIDDEDFLGEGVIKGNVYMTALAQARLIARISSNLTGEIINNAINKIEEGKMDINLEDDVIEKVAHVEFSLGFADGVFGPQSIDIDDLKKIDKEADAGASVVYILLDGTPNHKVPREGEAQEFLDDITKFDKAFYTAMDRADNIKIKKAD